MPITIPCSCGKSLKLKDELAGRKIRCPACSSVLSVPAPELEPELDEPELEPDEEPELDRETPRKKRRKKKSITPLTKKEKEELEFERGRERRELLRSVYEGIGFTVLGIAGFGGCIYGFVKFGGMAIFDDPLSFIILGACLVVTLGASIKGVLGLMSIPRLMGKDEMDEFVEKKKKKKRRKRVE